MKATFAAGCFWHVEEIFSKTNGVTSTAVGYTGGNTDNPTYDDVCSDSTGHAEAVEVDFDPELVSYQELLKIFFENHNPTTINRQGPDIGTQYRSEIFYSNNSQKEIAEKVLNKINQKLNGKVVTKISKEKNYCKAEEYHQSYLKKKGVS